MRRLQRGRRADRRQDRHGRVRHVRAGPTRNPRNPEHTPGGSSSGSAAAVAAGLVPLALGTQTIASVIRPAAYCGVAGFRPTRGRIPADGVIPFAPSLDVVGCFAADVAWLARAAAVLCDDWQPPAGPDARPALGHPSRPLSGARQSGRAGGVRRARRVAGGRRIPGARGRRCWPTWTRSSSCSSSSPDIEAARVHARLVRALRRAVPGRARQRSSSTGRPSPPATTRPRSRAPPGSARRLAADAERSWHRRVDHARGDRSCAAWPGQHG